MDRRKEPRLKVEFPVHIRGIDRMAHPFAEVVRVNNVSFSGAVLLGIHAKVRAGDILEVQHGTLRAQFRVAWASSGEAGIQALPSEPCIWNIASLTTLDMVGAG